MKGLKCLIFAMMFISILVSAQSAPMNQSGGGQKAAIQDDPTYRIGPEDILQIDVWKEPDFSQKSVPVRPDGKISLPLLNDIMAAGLTPMQLSDELASRLKKYVDSPRVTVVVTTVNSHKFFVLGEVTRPGAFVLAPKMTLVQAISTAGGFSQFANTKKISIVRNESGAQVKLQVNYAEVMKDLDKNPVIKPGDTIVVP